MRTTLTLDPDVASELERRREHGESFKHQVNHLLRLGLLSADEKPTDARPKFRTQPASVGALLVDSVDDVTAALELAEGETAT